MKDVTIAAVSMRSRPAAPEANLERHVSWIKRARDEGASVCLFPEMSVTGFCYDCQAILSAAEPLDGEATARMIELAAEHDVIIGFGLGARSDADLVSNAYVFVSAAGRLGHYRKTHIPIAEYAYETPGDEFSVTDLGAVRMGVNICFDNWFSEPARASFLRGAEVILAPFYMGGGVDLWRKLATINFPAAAWQNGVYHVTINACGGVHEKGMNYDGPPLILVYNPLGELECESDCSTLDEQIVVHTLEAAKLYERRGQPHFHPKYRRPAIYGDLVLPVNP